MKNYVNDTLKAKAANSPKKASPPPDNDDDGAWVGYPGEDDIVHMIFGGTPTRPSRC
jgi:hypothetical protein